MKIWSTLGRQTEERPDLHEAEIPNTRPVWLFIAGLLLFLAVSALGLAGLYRWLGEQPPMSGPALTPLAPARQVPPPPRLQTSPERDMRQMRADEERVLSSYGWVDQKAGIVRIPIERAMEMLVERGLPARTGSEAVPVAPATGARSGGPQTGEATPQQPDAAPRRPGAGPGRAPAEERTR